MVVTIWNQQRWVEYFFLVGFTLSGFVEGALMHVLHDCFLSGFFGLCFYAVIHLPDSIREQRRASESEMLIRMAINTLLLSMIFGISYVQYARGADWVGVLILTSYVSYAALMSLTVIGRRGDPDVKFARMAWEKVKALFGTEWVPS